MRTPGVLRALSYRNFSLYFSGQLVSLVGTWMQSTAQSWLVYRMTHSPFLMGLTVFIGLIPAFLIGVWGGVLADRYNKHTLIIITQTLEMLQAFVFAALVLSGHITIEWIFVLAALLGTIHAVDMPVRQSFIVDLASPEVMPSAIALNSSIFNAARIVGPALAGLFVAVANEGCCFLINGLSFFAVLLSLFLLKLRPHRRQKHLRSAFQQLRDGLSYAYRTPHVRSIFSILTIAVLSGTPYLTFMPIYANDILKSGPQGLGILMGGAGIGAFLGAIAIGGSKKTRYFGTTISLAVCGFGAGLVLFALSRSFAASFCILFTLGFSMMAGMVSSNILLQLLVPDHLRGRLMSIYSTIIVGVVPIGSLISGWAAKRWGVELTTVAGGVLSIFAGAWFQTQLHIFGDGMTATLAQHEKAMPVVQ
ncbi:MAG TPA: MFS transporter [bacterium]|nr:MFS transporter [bacterium]